jgi:hypothetical protein
MFNFRLPIALILFTTGLSAATVQMSLSAPGSQATFIGLAITETFNTPTTGIKTADYISSIGTYQLNTASAFSIINANQFGGANGTRYMSFGAQSSTTGAINLNLNANYNYFGFWWSAGDGNNGLTLYSGSQILGRITTADIINKLSPRTGQVQAVDGNFYNNSAYYGNPNNPTQNTGEPYAYVSLLVSGATFNRIVFDNSGQTGSGFESDNHSVFFGNVLLPGSSVIISTNTLIPEPSTYSLVGLGLLGVATLRRRRS